MYETAVVVATEKCSLGAKIPKMSLQAYDNSRAAPREAEFATQDSQEARIVAVRGQTFGRG